MNPINPMIELSRMSRVRVFSRCFSDGMNAINALVLLTFLPSYALRFARSSDALTSEALWL
jgi:hypothetical protein